MRLRTQVTKQKNTYEDQSDIFKNIFVILVNSRTIVITHHTLKLKD